MEIFKFVLIIGVVTAVAGLVIYLTKQAEKKRRAELAAFADDRGWEFHPSDGGRDPAYQQFKVFRRGQSPRAYNSMVGQLDIEGRAFGVRAGDFRYKKTTHTKNGRKTRTFKFSYLILHPPFGPLPHLSVRPEGFFDKVKGAFGFDDIDFESGEFSRRFHVGSSDRRFAYDVIHPQMMEFLMANRGPELEIDGGSFCIGDGEHRWSVETFAARMEFASRFFALWPDHVLADVAAKPAE